MKLRFCEHIFDIDKINQYDDIRYSKELSCSCEYAKYIDKSTFKIIGYIDTDKGFMAVFECPKCFEKYRHHINSIGRYNIDEFLKDIALILYLQQNLK